MSAVELEMVDVGRDELVLDNDTVERREVGRGTGLARGPFPVTLTLSRDDRVLPRELGRGETPGPFEVGDRIELWDVDWDFSEAEEALGRAEGEVLLILTLAIDWRVMTTFLGVSM